MRSLIPAAVLIFASTAVQAQEIVEVPASQANVARPDDLFNLPPGQWHMAKSLSGGSEPCASDQCEAGFTSVTEIGTPSSSSSIRRVSVNPLRACFAAQ